MLFESHGANRHSGLIMAHEAKIAGRKVSLEWTQEAAKRFRFRLSSSGGHPSQRELTSAKSADAAVCKLLWAMLPPQEVARHATPEDLFVAIDQDTESEALAQAIHGVYADMDTTPEKKTIKRKSPLRK